MSVLVSDRTESKFEAITYSIELHDMLIDRPLRNLGFGHFSIREWSGDCNGYIYRNCSGNFNGRSQYLCKSDH